MCVGVRGHVCVLNIACVSFGDVSMRVRVCACGVCVCVCVCVCVFVDAISLSPFQVWDLGQGKLIKDFREHDAAVSALDFHPQEFLMCSGSQDRTVRVSVCRSACVVCHKERLVEGSGK